MSPSEWTEYHQALNREVSKPKKRSEDIPLPSNTSAVEKLCLKTTSLSFELWISAPSTAYKQTSNFLQWQTSNFRLEHRPSVLPLLPKFIPTNLNLQKSWAAPDMPTGTGLLTLFWPLPWQVTSRDNARPLKLHYTPFFFFKTVALMKRALTKRWSLVKWGDLQCKMCICTSEIYISSSFHICFHSQVAQIWSRANWTPETVQTKPQMRQPAHTNQNEMLLYKIYRWLETLIFCLHTG